MFSEPYLVQRILSFPTKYNHANLWENIYFLFLWLLKKIMLASIQGDITMSNHLWKKRKKGNFSSVHFQKLSCFDRSLYFFLTPVESNLKKKCFASHLLHFVRKTKSICKGHELSEWLHMNSPSTLLVLSSWLLTVHRSCYRVSKSGNALERVHWVHEPADVWDITFCTRRFWLFNYQKINIFTRLASMIFLIA